MSDSLGSHIPLLGKYEVVVSWNDGRNDYSLVQTRKETLPDRRRKLAGIKCTLFENNKKRIGCLKECGKVFSLPLAIGLIKQKQTWTCSKPTPIVSVGGSMDKHTSAWHIYQVNAKPESHARWFYFRTIVRFLQGLGKE